MKEYIVSPSRLVNVKDLPNTRDITKTAEGLRLGTNVRVAEIAAHPEIQQGLAALAEAAAEVGSPQIRNVATLEAIWRNIPVVGIIASAISSVSSAVGPPVTAARGRTNISPFSQAIPA